MKSKKITVDKNYRKWLGTINYERVYGSTDADAINYDTHDKLTAREFFYLTLRKTGLNKYADQLVNEGYFNESRLLWLDHHLKRISDSDYYRSRDQLIEKSRVAQALRAENEAKMWEVRANKLGTKENRWWANQLKTKHK